MSVTHADKLAGVLPVVISGGRPALKDRPTARLLGQLRGVTRPPVWLVRDDRAAAYERDQHQLLTFGRDWAEDWAAAHWTSHEPYQPGAFLGAFTEREAACQLAEQQGAWAVLLLDDNLRRLFLMFMNRACTSRLAARHGGLGLFADLLAAVALSTNGQMVGAALSAAPPSADPGTMARPGFPYSLYLERLDLPPREPYYGPTEDDILHAIAYGANHTNATAALVPPLRYVKAAKQAGGMRDHYDATRSVGLQRMAPAVTRISAQRSHANGMGAGRVFHTMTRDAIRTPLVVFDRQLWDQARAAITGLADEFAAEYAADVARKVADRAARATHGPARASTEADEAAAAARRPAQADQPGRAPAD
jgi:hypothetical protein